MLYRTFSNTFPLVPPHLDTSNTDSLLSLPPTTANPIPGCTSSYRSVELVLLSE